MNFKPKPLKVVATKPEPISPLTAQARLYGMPVAVPPASAKFLGGQRAFRNKAAFVK